MAGLWLSKTWIAVATAAVAVLACFRPALAGDASAVAAEVTGDASRSILTIELSHPVTYKVFALDKPYRVVVDLPAIEFQLPKGTGKEPFGLVSDFRYGLIGPGRSRLVIDTTGPVIVESAGILSQDGSGEAQFKIALAATDAATFAARQPHRVAKAKPVVIETETSFIPKPKDARSRHALPLVVLDPGHGGPDSGAVSPDGSEEKNIVLAVSKKVRDLLAASHRYKAEMTRDSDVFVTLSGRVDYAEQHNADLMVSIHADSTSSSRRWQPVSGATVYTRSETASDEESRILALKENMSDQLAGEAIAADEGKAVSNIGLDLARTETKALDQVLAGQTVSRLAKVSPMTSEAHRGARFYVLKSPKVPAMLIESGYMNNRLDATHLQSADWQGKFAGAVVAAIDAYFAERDKGLTTLLGLGIPEPVQ